MNKNDTIYVAGHNGLVGSAIVRYLHKEGYNNILTKTHDRCDLTNHLEVNGLFFDEEPDYVFLAAAKVGGILANKSQPADFIYDNLMIQNNVINASLNYSVKKLLFLGSSCIYPRNCPQPIREEYLMTGPLETTNEGYAIAKIAGIKYCRACNEQYNTNFISCMPTNLYGPCFSGDTEVLTPKGIINIKDLKINDLIYTLNPKTLEIEIEKVKATQKNKTKEFFNFKNSGVDFRVTSDHDIYCSIGNNKKFVKIKAEWFRTRAGKKYGQLIFAHAKSLKQTVINPLPISLMDYTDKDHIITADTSYVRDFKHSKSKFFPLMYNINDFIKFIGWYVAEGSAVKNYYSKGGKQSTEGLNIGQIRISQDKSKNLANWHKIKRLLKNMNIPFGCDDYAFYFSSRMFRNFIEKEIGIGSDQVKIPTFIFNENFPNYLRQKLFNTLMRGDGNKDLRRYTTKSKKLRDDIIHLSFLLGYKTTSIKYDSGAWRIRFRQIRKNCCAKYKNISIEQADEYTYCITTEKNHIIYAGRNKKFNWIGQCDNYNLQTSHVLPALIKKIHNAKVSNKKHVILWGDGSPMREFLYVDDLAEACVHLMNNYDKSEIINVGTGKDISIKQLAQMIKQVVGYTGGITWNTDMPNGTPRKVLDVSKMGLLNWYPKTGLMEGLAYTYKDFLYGKIR